MTKAELINLIAEKGDYSKKDAEKALTTVIDSVSETLLQRQGQAFLQVKHK